MAVRELESVGVTTLATALMIGDLCVDNESAMDLLKTIEEAGLKRMDAEKINTDHHLKYAKAGNASYADALANEKEVLLAWGKWYDEAIDSVATLVDEPSEGLQTAIAASKEKVDAKVKENLSYAEKIMNRAAAAEKARVTGVKGSSKKSRITLQWKKTKDVTGYEVVYKKKGAKKFIHLKDTKKLKTTTKKLKKGRKYQFKVRAYTKISGVRVYGPYSKVTTVKCK